MCLIATTAIWWPSQRMQVLGTCPLAEFFQPESTSIFFTVCGPNCLCDLMTISSSLFFPLYVKKTLSISTMLSVISNSGLKKTKTTLNLFTDYFRGFFCLFVCFSIFLEAFIITLVASQAFSKRWVWSPVYAELTPNQGFRAARKHLMLHLSTVVAILVITVLKCNICELSLYHFNVAINSQTFNILLFLDSCK